MTFETLQKDMITAMKAHDKARKEAISTLVSAVKKLAIDEGKRDDITEDIVARAVLKEQKAAKEQLDTCPDTRAELKAEYQFRYDVITEYCPTMMSEADVKKLLTDKYSELIATKNKGVIMKTIMGELKGKAEGSVISKVVAELCQ